MSTISASTTSTTGFVVTSNTTGTLVFQTGASPTTAVTIGSDQKVTFAYPPTATGGGSVSTNTAYGTSALGANTTGSNQAAFGYQAGYTQTTADRNTIMGAQAGYAATNGSANAYFGYQAGYGNTTGYLGVAVGAYALAASSTGYQNTAVGAYALTVATGNYNVSVGKDSGLALTTGSYNTFAGPGAGYAMTTGSKNTIIGAYGGNQGGLDMRTANNYIVLSDGDGNPKAGFAGNTVGFPAAMLVGQTNAGVAITTDNGAGTGYVNVNHSTGDSGGNWYCVFTRAGTAVGSILSVGTNQVIYNTSSDYRLKDITGPVTGSEAAQFIMALQPKRGSWKSDGAEFVGFLAHEFQEVSPSSVHGEKDAVDEKGEMVIQSMQSSSPEVMANVIALLQDLHAKVEAQAAEIATLKGAA